MRYEDWFKKSDFDPLELALLMAETAPHGPLGKDILAFVDGGETDPEFLDTYSNKEQQWEFFETFRRARRLIFESLHLGSLAPYRKLNPVRIPRDASLMFVLEAGRPGNPSGETYKLFIETAASQTMGSCETFPSATPSRKKSEWWHAEFEKLIDFETEECFRLKGKRLKRDGTPSKTQLAKEIAKKIKATEDIRSREEGRLPRKTVGPESIRNLLKDRSI